MSWHSIVLCIGLHFGLMNQVDETVFNKPRIIRHLDARNSSRRLMTNFALHVLVTGITRVQCRLGCSVESFEVDLREFINIWIR